MHAGEAEPGVLAFRKLLFKLVTPNSHSFNACDAASSHYLRIRFRFRRVRRKGQQNEKRFMKNKKAPLYPSFECSFFFKLLFYFVAFHLTEPMISPAIHQ